MRNKRDQTGLHTYTVTNIAEDRALNCDENDDLATADVLGTLIKDLIESGIISGSVS